MRQFRKQLLASTIMCGVALTLAGPASAQDATQQAEDTAPESDAEVPTSGTESPAVPTTAGNEDGEIVVTGTLFRRTNDETPSPVTVLSSEAIARRGLNSIADAVRSLSADNSGSIPTAFSNGFAYGASGVSLRGLSVNSTLTVFDGLRGAYYPLADDGQRSFVDLNTIPQIAVDRVEVLRDGASSTYGADAIGGVVNIITRKEYQGVQLTGEGGITQRGDAGEHRFTALAGTGDLSEDGWSAYVGAEYQHSDRLMASRRGFPYNTFDYSSLTCGVGADAHPCANYNSGATTAGNTISAVVRPVTLPNPSNILVSTPVDGWTYRVLNPNGCAPGTIARSSARGNFCEMNVAGTYAMIQPEQTRIGVTARGTVRVGETAEAYAMGTYYQNEVFSSGYGQNARQSFPTNTQTIALPALLANGQLNPNNPYAAQGLGAQIFYRFGDIPVSTTTLSKTYRGAAGISGTFGEGGTYTFDVTGMHTDLHITRRGLLNLPALTTAIRTGTYNFVNPALNSDATRKTIAPDVANKATSDLYMAQAIATKEVAQLPGGPLQVGAGASIRYEALDNPNANPNLITLGLNPVTAKGNRTVTAGFVEVNAPLHDMLEINASGRFDHYSEGYDRFSPKIGAKFTPVRELALRGTYSRGFRAPQFGETAGSVTGFITHPTLPCNVVLAHGGTATGSGGCTGGSAYVSTPFSLGLTSSANPDIKPEKSQSFTLGAVFQPVRWFSMTLDYYHIKKTDVISAGPDYGLALSNYYAGQALPPGYTVVLNAADPDHPNAIRTVAFVNVPYVNAASQVTSGIDFAAQLQLPLAEGVRFSSAIEVTKILKSNLTSAGGTQEYVGTQGPYQLSSGAGTPAWRGNWSNSLEIGSATFTTTAYYTSGYRSTADDSSGPGTSDDCENALFDPAFCKTKRFINVDFTGSYDVGEQFTFYVNVLNLFDAKAPFNPANYAGINYNPTWSQAGVVGRAFRAGARVKF